MNRAEYARMFEAEEKQWWYAGMRAISWSLLEKASLPPGARILDGGCGTGENLVHLGKMGEAIGIDLSEEALSLCATRGVRLVRGSVLGLPFGEGTFDLVTSFDVLYHLWVTDPGYEREYLLKPDGDYEIGETFLTVSLGEPLNDYCYKLVAAIIERART